MSLLDWFESHRFVTLAFVMILIWGSFGIYIINYGEVMIKDPCSICTNKTGNYVTCVASRPGGIPISKTYSPDGNVSSDYEDIKKLIEEEYDRRKTVDFNLSEFNFTTS